MRTWSPSALRAYRTCPRQWHLRYKDSRPGKRAEALDTPPSHLRMGTAAHAGLEAAYMAARDALNWSPGTRMMIYGDEAVDAIRAAWERLELESSSAQIEDEVSRTLDALPVPRPEAVLGVELEIRNEVEGYPFVNVLDLALRTGARAIHIRDWKRRSLRTLPRVTELPDDPAMCSYRLAVAERFPWARRVTVGLYSLVNHVEVVADLPLARAAHVMSGEVAIIEQAEDDTSWIPTPDGRNCGSCSVRSRCPLFA